MFSIKRLNKLLWMQHEVCDYNSNKKYTKWKQNETNKKKKHKKWKSQKLKQLTDILIWTKY